MLPGGVRLCYAATMEYWQACLIVCPAAAVGGAINAIAGGGTLVTFPALMLVLESISGAGSGAILANGTNTVALCPGSFSSSWGYRREVRELWRLDATAGPAQRARGRSGLVAGHYR